MTFDPLKPYNDLPDLPPMIDLETKPVLKKAITLENEGILEKQKVGKENLYLNKRI